MVFILLRFKANLKIRRIPATYVIHLARFCFETNFQFVGRIAAQSRRTGRRGD